MKRNNALPNNHFKKTAKTVKTWFNQPAKAAKRKAIRAEKAKKIRPVPLQKLRPIVRCETIRYNRKQRLGRGFTPEECHAAGLDYKYARTIGIAVDLRRKNANQESFEENVARLQEYQSKITIYSDLKEAKKAGAESYKGVIMPIKKSAPVVATIKAEEISAFN